MYRGACDTVMNQVHSSKSAGAEFKNKKYFNIFFFWGKVWTTVSKVQYDVRWQHIKVEMSRSKLELKGKKTVKLRQSWRCISKYFLRGWFCAFTLSLLYKMCEVGNLVYYTLCCRWILTHGYFFFFNDENWEMLTSPNKILQKLRFCIIFISYHSLWNFQRQTITSKAIPNNSVK